MCIRDSCLALRRTELVHVTLQMSKMRRVSSMQSSAGAITNRRCLFSGLRTLSLVIEECQHHGSEAGRSSRYASPLFQIPASLHMTDIIHPTVRCLPVNDVSCTNSLLCVQPFSNSGKTRSSAMARFRSKHICSARRTRCDSAITCSAFPVPLVSSCSNSFLTRRSGVQRSQGPREGRPPQTPARG